MDKKQARVIDRRFHKILTHEYSWAEDVAKEVIKVTPNLMLILMLPVLMTTYRRAKKARQAFAQNLMFTKITALELALEMIQKGLVRDEAMSQVRIKTKKVLASVRHGLYSEEIRRAQIEEIDLLIDHYCRLLQVEGKDYKSLLLVAYKSSDNYADFIEKLNVAEKEINRAAMKTMGTEDDIKEITEIEIAADRIRKEMARKIFVNLDQ